MSTHRRVSKYVNTGGDFRARISCGPGVCVIIGGQKFSASETLLEMHVANIPGQVAVVTELSTETIAELRRALAALERFND